MTTYTRSHTILRRLLAIAIVAIAAIPVASAQSASTIVDRAITKLHSYKSIRADYSISADGERRSGVMVVEGNRFLLDMRVMQVWFDGTTQWTYLPQEQEVTICEPSASELQQINPFAVIDSARSQFTAKSLKSTTSGVASVELTPKKGSGDSGISKIVVDFNTSTSLPQRLVITMSSHSVVTINISSIKGGDAMGVERFRPHPRQFRSSEVIDLR